MDSQRCPMCGATVPESFGGCRAVFDDVHLMTIDAYALQHSEEHGPRSNASHLLPL